MDPLKELKNRNNWLRLEVKTVQLAEFGAQQIILNTHSCALITKMAVDA